ncbi:hypothetical protein BH11VER1_BH11VER1_24640 [soil metagenome]
MFEHKTEKLLSLPGFLRRMMLSLLLSIGVLVIALGIGVVGYHELAGLDWIDSILNASMILTGMGPIAPMTDATAKLFASAYALFSGVVFLSAMGLVLTPIFHRVLHMFHLDDTDENEETKL